MGFGLAGFGQQTHVSMDDGPENKMCLDKYSGLTDGIPVCLQLCKQQSAVVHVASKALKNSLPVESRSLWTPDT